MATHWYVVAHRAEARVFQQVGIQRSLSLVKEIENADGRLQNKDIDSDRGGRVARGYGQGYHQLSPEHSATDQNSELFAIRVAKELEHDLNAHSFNSLVIVAEPHFLGILKGAFSPALTKVLRSTLPKDFTSVPENELCSRLEEVLMIREAV